MKEYARAFYNGKAWRKVSRLYMTSQNYICERCGGVGVICHHKRYITPANVNDQNITLNPDNLECLCQECHNIEHMQKHAKTYFNDAGEIEKVKEPAAIAEYKRAANEIDRLLEKLKP